MTLRPVLRPSLLALCLTFLLQPARAQNFDNVEIQVVDVADGVYMLVGSGGNIGVSAGEDGVFLIDDQYAPLTDKIRAAVATISDQPIRFVLNTHWHGDHTGGNENLGEAGVLIVAHDNVRERMSTEQVNTFFERTTPPSPDAALPVITFGEDVTFHLNGNAIHAFHVEPGHTDGDAVIHFRGANAVHMGDLYFASGYPFIDLSSGGNVDGVINAAATVLGMIDDETKVIPGHGPLSDKAGLQAYHDMLVDIRDTILEMIADGKSLDEVLAAKPTAAYDAEWGQSFIKPEPMVRFVYTSLSQENVE